MFKRLFLTSNTSPCLSDGLQINRDKFADKQGLQCIWRSYMRFLSLKWTASCSPLELQDSGRLLSQLRMEFKEEALLWLSSCSWAHATATSRFRNGNLAFSQRQPCVFATATLRFRNGNLAFSQRQPCVFATATLRFRNGNLAFSQRQPCVFATATLRFRNGNLAFSQRQRRVFATATSRFRNGNVAFSQRQLLWRTLVGEIRYRKALYWKDPYWH